MCSIDVVPNYEQLFDSCATIPCVECGLTVRLSCLNKHAKKLHVNYVVRYFCCEKDCRRSQSSNFGGFSSIASVKQHVKLVHCKDMFICPKCPRTFKTKHSMQHHSKECGVKYLCSCDVFFSTKRGLQLHVKNSNHDIPDHLKHLFQQNVIKCKPEKRMISVGARTTTNNQRYRSILPKEITKITTLNNSRHVCIPIKNNAKSTIFLSKVKTIQINTIQNGKPWNNEIYKNTQDIALQFPNPTSTIDGSCQTALNTIVPQCISTTTDTFSISNNNNQLAKDISSQTDLNSWLNIEASDISSQTELRSLYENNATQTNKTDSAMCQTDWDLEDLIQGDNEKWQISSTNEICDAQIQTTSLGYFNFHPEGQYFNKELTDINTTTAETQTLNEKNLSDEQIENLDILLNHIETQTDFGSLPLDDMSGPYSNLINSSTQTNFGNPFDIDFSLNASGTPFSSLF